MASEITSGSVTAATSGATTPDTVTRRLLILMAPAAPGETQSSVQTTPSTCLSTEDASCPPCDATSASRRTAVHGAQPAASPRRATPDRASWRGPWLLLPAPFSLHDHLRLQRAQSFNP